MSDVDEPEGTFAIYFAEGEALAKQGQYVKAIHSYTMALDMEDDKACLVARSKCHLQLGNTALALQDAEDSLLDSKKFHKGLYQKAEVLYSMGDFEHALMFYHRGHKIRPELDQFVLGIQKAHEAVNNSIGTPEACKLEKIGDLSFFQQQENIGKKKKKLMKPSVVKQKKKERQPVASEKTIRELLGEMYADREYLDKLMADPSLVVGHKDRSIYKEVEDALIYLDARTDFWRQQKPMYARKREKELKRYKRSPTVPICMGRLTGDEDTSANQHTKIVLRSLEDIDAALANGDAESSLQKAEKLMKTVLALTEKDLPGKQEYIASLHSCIGNAQLELGEAELALEHHFKDLAIGEKLKHAELLSRALDNVGRVFAVMGKFRRASDYWSRKLSLVASSEESAWLHHELGRCQLELANYSDALQLGKKSLAAAQEAKDQMWELNGFMLIAQAECRLGEFDSSVENFDKALELARILEDEATEASIVKAMEDVKEKTEAAMTGVEVEGEEVDGSGEGGGKEREGGKAPSEGEGDKKTANEEGEAEETERGTAPVEGGDDGTPNEVGAAEGKGKEEGEKAEEEKDTEES